MSFLYPIVSDVTASLNSGSYLNKTDYNLFVKGSSEDFLYGTSDADVIEFFVYDLNQNLVYWKPMGSVGHYKDNVLTYYDSKNDPVYYTYRQFIFDRPLYKTQKVLMEPLADLSSSNVSSGNYVLSYNLTRYLAGTPFDPLVIKEISPSKTELKLIPSDKASIRYNAFCVNKMPLDDVSPLYLKLTSTCPYGTLFNSSVSENQTQIDLIKNLFFIPSDGKFVEFLRFLYEDFIKFSSISDNQAQTFTRIQGIRTYFSNFLVSNTRKVFSFDDIKSQFSKFVSDRLDLLFINFKSEQYLYAKKYLYNLFVNSYFLPIHNLLQSKYEEKYHDPLKNVLSYGIGIFIPILTTSFIDERQSDSDPLTLLVKLQSPIGDDLSIKSNVWVSNAGMVPVLFNSIVKENGSGKTIKISPPDFTIIPQNVSFTNSNISYNNTNLQNDSLDENLVNVSKKLNELNVDYSSLNNFVVFSSAGLRHKIFKNKMISLSSLSSSMSTLETNYSNSGYSYPYYTSEKESITKQESDVINSFDGWESYLYKTGYYIYNSSEAIFNSQSFVDDMDGETERYDKFNRDSLVNNTPEHIVLDRGNDDYLIFLSMIGHYFDNLYLYIRALPTERVAENTNNLSKNVLQQMLQSFGWNLNTSLETFNISDNYLDSSLDGSNELSAEERNRQIWSRILNTLPIIYKTKGTEECIRTVLSCFGVPSTMISVKEYGGMDYSKSGKTSYSIEEKLFMLTFKGYQEYIRMDFYPTIRTVEFKVSLDPTHQYAFNQRIPLVIKQNVNSAIDWIVGVYKEKEQNLGRVYFRITTGSMAEIVSDPLPIFTGDIFNVMIRKNDPDPLFEYNINVDLVPAKYDLRVQRKEDGREIFSSYSSTILTQSFNYAFENVGQLYFGNYQTASGFVGTLDKILVWETPITDFTFDDHCNDISSYSYTGSAVAHEVLYFRMNFDYPVDLSSINPSFIPNSNTFYSSGGSALAFNFGIQSYSGSVEDCLTVSHSAFPYQFTEVPYNQTLTISSYGPNKFKNNKIQEIELPLAVRLDPNERSSYSPNTFLTPDSNQIGLFADPNDYKNKDIFRYFGDYNLMATVGSPSQMFDDRYYPLKNVREVYNNSGDKKVLFNEMFTLYRFYFDKSIFETIKQLIPARNNVLSGILIEPTVLERPKYQYKRIGSETVLSVTSSAVPSTITNSINHRVQTLSFGSDAIKVEKISGDFVSADFKLNREMFSSQLYEHVPFFISEGPYSDDDPIYLEFQSLKNRLVYVPSGWIKKNPLDGELYNVETHANWIVPGSDFGPVGSVGQVGSGGSLVDVTFNGFFKFEGTMPGFYPTGSGYYYLKNCYFYLNVNQKMSEVLDVSSRNLKSGIDLSTTRLPTFNYHTIFRDGIIRDIDNPEELGVFCDDNGKIVEATFTGSSPRYMVKKWDRDHIFIPYGNYKKPQSVNSQSLFFYSTQIWENPDNIGVVNTSENTYYESFSGYSRNHLTNKRLDMSCMSFGQLITFVDEFDRYVKGKQTVNTTVNENGLTDGSLPVQSINVSNINIIRTENVLK